MTAPTFSFLALLIAGLLLATDLYGGGAERVAAHPAPTTNHAMLAIR
jgi:hypothetical protein